MWLPVSEGAGKRVESPKFVCEKEKKILFFKKNPNVEHGSDTKKILPFWEPFEVGIGQG